MLYLTVILVTKIVQDFSTLLPFTKSIILVLFTSILMVVNFFAGRNNINLDF